MKIVGHNRRFALVETVPATRKLPLVETGDGTPADNAKGFWADLTAKNRGVETLVCLARGACGPLLDTPPNGLPAPSVMAGWPIAPEVPVAFKNFKEMLDHGA